MATVELSFTALPAHVRTARLVATAVARRSGVDESLLDEVRLAVGEACSRAVEGHQLYCPGEPVRLSLTDMGGRFEVEVTDPCAPGTRSPAGPGAVADTTGADTTGADTTGADPAGAGSASGAATGPEAGVPAGLGIAVIEGLADQVQISETPAGTSIRMSWPSAGHTR
jgi:anti-sigma regulatory factor (Ser/Thr protein kinase)